MKIRSAAFMVLFSLLGGVSIGGAAPPVRVPQDAGALAAAISRVADGGVIESAAGIDSPVGGSFVIGNLRKGLTIRAAARVSIRPGGSG